MLEAIMFTLFVCTAIWVVDRTVVTGQAARAIRFIRRVHEGRALRSSAHERRAARMISL